MSPGGVIQRTRLRLPIRVKLAVVSGVLTFVILLLFAVVVGAVTDRQVHASFDDDVRAAASDLQERIRVRTETDGDIRLDVPPDIIRAAAAGGAAIRLVDASGRLVNQTPDAPELGPPLEGQSEVSGYRVESRPIFIGSMNRSGPLNYLRPPVDEPVAFVQYAKPMRGVNATAARVRLFLALGVLGGTALAFLAGFLVARRAMRPIAGLTRAARDVARTRNPDVRLPKPEADDEVAELATTLEDMLGELGAARAETESALERQRAFVADASHELRTPLTSILANLELLEAELASDQEEIAASALRSARRMRRLVADLLLLARADAGRRAPTRPVDLAAVGREAAAEADPLASGHEISVDAPEPVTVEGAPDELHRLVLNLIENALVHTPAGTPVTVSARADGGDALLEVADRGPGVPAELRGRIFERFARGQGDASATGSGLGLAIVRAVAEGHGGTVGLDEAEGGGARFRVRLPRSAGAPTTPVPPRAESEPAG